MKNLLTFCLSLLLLACSQQKNKTSDSLCILNMDNQITKQITISNVMGQLTVIPLSVEEGGMVGDVNKVIQKGDYFYVLSNFKKINKFDKNGKCLFEIMSVGGAKGEYAGVYDFDVSNDCIYLVDRTERVLVFDNINGVYKKDIELNFICSAIKVFQNKLLCEASEVGTSIYICTLDGHIINNIVKNDFKNQIMSTVPFVDIDDNRVAYTMFDHNDTYVIDLKKDMAKEEFIVDMKDVLTSHIYTDLVKRFGKVNEYGLMDVGEQMDKYYCISAFRKVEKKALVTFYMGDQSYVGISDVNSGQNSVFDVANLVDDMFASNVTTLMDNISMCSSDKAVVSYIQPLDIVNEDAKKKFAENIANGNPILLTYDL